MRDTVILVPTGTGKQRRLVEVRRWSPYRADYHARQFLEQHPELLVWVQWVTPDGQIVWQKAQGGEWGAIRNTPPAEVIYLN